MVAVREVNTCQVKAGKIFRGSIAAGLGVGFFKGISCWGHLQSRSLRITVTPSARLPDTVNPLFFLVPSYLYISQLWQSLGEVTLTQVLHTVALKHWGSWLLTFFSLSQRGKLQMCSLLVLRSASQRARMIQQNEAILSSLYVWLFSSFLFHCLA